MNICGNCRRASVELTKAFTFVERVHMLTCVVTMRRHLDSNVNAPSEDKEVSSSIVTKILLSLDEGPREQLLKMLRQSSGVGIVLGSCPHGISVVGSL